MAKINIEIEEVLRKAIERLREHTPIDAAYLFGSYAVGDAKEDSDIDLAAFGPEVGKIPVEEKVKIIARVQMEIGASVEIHLFDTSCLEKARPTNIFGVILENGTKIK